MLTNQPYYYKSQSRKRHKRGQFSPFFIMLAVVLLFSTVALAIDASNAGSAPSTSPGQGNTWTDNTTTLPGNTSNAADAGKSPNKDKPKNDNSTTSTFTPDMDKEIKPDEMEKAHENETKIEEEIKEKSDKDDRKTDNLTDDDVIIKTNPIIDVMHLGNIPFAFKKSVFEFFRGITDPVIGLASTFLKIMDAAADPLLTADFTSGPFSKLYEVAKQVAHTVGIPFGTAICGLSFMVGMVELSERHRRYESKVGVLDTVLLVFSMAVGVFLIYHAVDICALVYTLASNAVAFLKDALNAQGITTATATMSNSMTHSMTEIFDTMKYKDFGMSFFYCALSFAIAISCGGVMVYVMLQGLLRMGELYLRAAFSPIVIGFVSAKSTRPMAIQYLKRFGAVALNAALIVMALALGGLLYSVAAQVISPAIGKDAVGLVKLIGTIAPMFVAVTAVKELVQRSQQVSLSIFGLN